MGYFNKKNNRGFTLVELMVAIAIFSIVMVTAMSALLNVIDANNKARAIKTAVNNISFALEGISKDMRVGTDYACGEDADFEPSGDCLNGGKIIKYKSIRTYNPDFNERYFAYYAFRDTQILECLDTGPDFCSGHLNDTSGEFFAPITSSEVKINDATFFVIGAEDFHNISAKTQPRMIMTVSGEAGIKEKVKTYFDLQTSVSQRMRAKTL